MKKYLCLSLSLLLTMTAFASGQEDKISEKKNGLPLIFTEDFTDRAERWEPTDPEAWKRTVEDNDNIVYSLFKQSDYEPEVRSPVNYSLIKDLWVSDFILDVKMKSTIEPYNHMDLCLFFGWQDPSHFYYVHIAPAPNSDPHANSVFLVNGEPRKSIAHKRNDGTEWEEGKYHHVRIIRDTEEGTIQVFFDDMSKPIIEAKDKTFKIGRMGVGSFDDTGNFDDIRIWGKRVDPPESQDK